MICGDDEIFKCMATKMKAKYEKYWGDPEKMNKYIFIAAILDPRTKESHFFKDMIDDTYGSIIGNRILTSSHNEFVSLFGEYKVLYGTGTTSESASQAHASENGSKNSLMRSRYNKKRMRVCGEGSTSTNTITELDKYLAEDTEELTAEFDLDWWKCNAARFPVL